VDLAPICAVAPAGATRPVARAGGSPDDDALRWMTASRQSMFDAAAHFVDDIRACGARVLKTQRRKATKPPRLAIRHSMQTNPPSTVTALPPGHPRRLPPDDGAPIPP